MSEESVVKYDEMGVMDGGTVGLRRPMNRDIWLKEVFPEWGTFLNYEIDAYEVQEGKGVCWFLGGPSYALKSRAGAVFTIDLYAGPSLFTDYSYCGVCKQVSLVDHHRVGQQGLVPAQEFVHRFVVRLDGEQVGHPGPELPFHRAVQVAAEAGALVDQLDAAAGELGHVVTAAVVKDVHRQPPSDYP